MRSARPGRHRHGRRTRWTPPARPVLWLSRLPGRLGVAVVVLALVAAALPQSSLATFSAATANGASTLGADTLDPPTGLGAVAGGTVSLSWTATVDTYAAGHRILRATTSGGPYTQVAQVSPRTTTTYVDNPPGGAATYYYVARAYAGGWESANSNQVTATVTAVGQTGTWQTGLTHTAGAGPSRALVFVASNEQQVATTPTLTSVTYGGRPLTRVFSRQHSSTDITADLEVWLLDEAGLAAATSSSFVATWSAAPNIPLYAHAVFTNVAQPAPQFRDIQSALATGNTPNPVPVPVTTAPRDVVVGAATAGDDGSFTAQNGFVLGTTQGSSTGGSTALGTAHKAAVGTAETVALPFAPVSSTINRQIAAGVVLKVKP